MELSTKRYNIAGLNIEMTLWDAMTARQAEKYRCDFSGEPDLVLEHNKERIDWYIENKKPLTAEQCEYVFTGAWFNSRLLEHNGFMLHSSAVYYGGKAYLFSADSGTGKSTHTALWLKYLGDKAKILNDDKPAVRIIDGKCYACGTPWSGKNDNSTNAIVEIGGIVFLERSTTPKIERENDTLFAITNILRQTIMPRTVDANDSLFKLMEKLIADIPVYKLYADIGEEAFKTSFEGLTGEEYKING